MTLERRSAASPAGAASPGLRLTVTCALLPLAMSCGPGRRPPFVTLPQCSVQGCGSNSPELTGSRFVDALNLDGIASANGVRFVPGSFRCGTSPAERKLDIRGSGELVGMEGGAPVCRGDGLVGAQFRIEWSAPGVAPTLRSATISISGVAKVSTWHREAASQEVLPTYQFQWKPPGEQAFVPLCPTRTAWMDGWQVGGLVNGRENPDGVVGLPWREETDHALILHGETYNLASDADPERRGPRWFNIACAGAAFSKMRLLGHDPTADPESHGDRQATLKMLTARYKGATSHTKQGMPLKWVSARGIQYYGDPEPSSVGPIEARWMSDGATCLDHLRTWRKNDAPGLPEAKVRVSFSSASMSHCVTGGSGTQGVVWTTYTVDHIDHP